MRALTEQEILREIGRWLAAWSDAIITGMLVSVFVASLFEGLGMSMLLSMLSLAGGSSDAPPSRPQQLALDVVSHLGIMPTALNLLFVAIVLIAMRGASIAADFKAMVATYIDRRYGKGGAL